MYSSLSELGLTILHQFLNASAAIFRKAHKSGNSSLTTSTFILIVIGGGVSSFANIAV